MTHNKFSQPEVLAGYLQELKVDTQGAYLATIKLLNDAVLEVSLPKELVGQIGNDKTDLLSCTKLVELSGNAIYRGDGLSMILDSFRAESLRTQQDSNDLEQWVDGFISCGPSGWNQFDNQMEVWLDDRHE